MEGLDFLSDRHQKQFFELAHRDETDLKDFERRALFFIIAGSDALFSKAERIYDFRERWARFEVLDEEWVTGGQRSLIALAFNLYNGDRDHRADPASVFSLLNARGRRLALRALAYRFRIR